MYKHLLRGFSAFSLFLFFLVRISPAQATPLYNVSDLAPSTVGNTNVSYFPKKINVAGQMVGTKQYLDSGEFNSQYWLGGQEIPAGGMQSVAYDISGNNIVVGRAYFGGGSNRAYTYNISSLNFSWLPCPVFGSGNGFCEAYAINNDVIVGTSDPRFLYPQNPDANSRALLWDSGVATELFPGIISIANDVNGSGTITGMVNYEPFIRTNSGALTLLGGHSNTGSLGLMVFASAINDAGHVVGGHTVNAEGLAQRAFFWNGSVAVDIGTLGISEVPPGQSRPVVGANDINDHDQIVGGAAVGFDHNGIMVTHAFIWDPQTGMRDINDLISPSSGVVLSEAVGINDSGDIVASGYVQGGSPYIQRAYVLRQPKTPLVFIPGVAGSSLYEADENGDPIVHQFPSLEVSAIWPNGLVAPAVLGLEKLYLDPEASPHRNIIAVDSLEQISPFYQVYKPLFDNLRENGYVRYETGMNPKKRKVGSGSQDCNGDERYDGREPMLFVFAYDWRKTNVDAADQLKDYIECVQEFHPNQKVNILTHSMGGLIARRYLLANPNDDKVDKLITTVAPFLGAPKAIDVLHSGRFIGKYDYYVRRNVVQRMISYSKGAHELLPSEWYYDLDQRPFAYKSLFLGLEDYTYVDTKRILNAKFPSRPYDTGQSFHAYPEGSKLQDNWSTDSSGVKFYHLYGVQAWDTTPGRVIELPFGGITPSERKYAVKVEKTDGDGTVPTISARRAAEGLNSFLTTPSATVKRCESASYLDDDNYEHGGILKNPVIFNEVHAILNDSVIYQDECDRDDMNSNLHGQSQGASSPENNSVSVNSLFVYGVDRLQIADTDGNTNTTISYGVDQAVPGIDYEYGSEVSDPVIAPHELRFAAGKGVDVKFIAPSSGLIRIELNQGTSSQVHSEVIKYLDLQIPSGVVAWIKFNAAETASPHSLILEVENLRYDADGDGVFETEVQPTLVLSGPAANDRTPPVLELSYTVSNGVATITAAATDAETGIRQMRYIVHGEENDHLYTAPFTVDVSQSSLVYVNAEDNAGNRSILARWLDAASPVTTSVQTPLANSDGWSNGDVSVELKAKDDVGGSGIDSLTFSGSGAQTVEEETVEKYYDPLVFPEPSTATDSLTKNLPITAEGVTNISFHAKDRAGNVESEKSLTVKIDKSIPTASHSLAQSGQQSTITLTANDTVSGIKEIRYSLNGGSSQVYSAPFTLPTNSNTVVTYFAKDFAGNESTTHVMTVSSASLSGKVYSSQSQHPLSGAQVVVRNEAGTVLGIVTTNTFGNYQFGTLAIDQTYTISVTHRRYDFDPRTLLLVENVQNFNFYPVP